MGTSNCTFCDIVNGKKNDFKIWENDRFLLFLDKAPTKLGHCLLITKKHVDYVFDLDEELYKELFMTAKKLSVPLKKATGAMRIGIGVVGLEVPHVHVHLIPLHNSNEMFIQKFAKVTLEEMREIQEKIRKSIS